MTTYPHGIHGTIGITDVDPDTGLGTVTLCVTADAADFLRIGANVMIVEDPGRCEECYARSTDFHAGWCPFNTFQPQED
jgi:hypothetical protein